MKCESTQDWLLQCDELRPKAWPKDVRSHVKGCTVCYEFARSVRRVEKAWRDQPLPTQAIKPHPKFLKKIVHLEETDKATKPTAPVAHPWRPVRWIASIAAVAAVLLIGVLAAFFLLATPGQTHASPSDVMERLVDWSLEMSRADAKDRKRLLAEKIEKFRQELLKAKLTADELAIADDLLNNAIILADEEDEEDPIEALVRINEITDKLKAQADEATKKGDLKESERCNELAKKMEVKGANPIIDRISEYKTPEGPKKPGFSSFMKYDPAKQQQLQDMLKRGPGPGFGPGPWPGPGPGFGPGHGPGPGFGPGMQPRPDVRKQLDAMRYKPKPPPSSWQKWGKKS